jgi:hypothetical protein
MFPRRSTAERTLKIFCCEVAEKPTASIECFNRTNSYFSLIPSVVKKLFCNSHRVPYSVLSLNLIQVVVVAWLQQKMRGAFLIGGPFEEIIENVVVSFSECLRNDS